MRTSACACWSCTARCWARSLTLPRHQLLLHAAATRGIRWGISTNKPRAYTEPLLEQLDISTCTGQCGLPDDVTHRKPHPESLYLNCQQLQCSPHEAIYIGDHRRDIEAGKRAGMFTIAAAYGYIEPDDNAADWGADAQANSSEALAEMILGNH